MQLHSITDKLVPVNGPFLPHAMSIGAPTPVTLQVLFRWGYDEGGVNDLSQQRARSHWLRTPQQQCQYDRGGLAVTLAATRPSSVGLVCDIGFDDLLRTGRRMRQNVKESQRTLRIMGLQRSGVGMGFRWLQVQILSPPTTLNEVLVGS